MPHINFPKISDRMKGILIGLLFFVILEGSTCIVVGMLDARNIWHCSFIYYLLIAFVVAVLSSLTGFSIARRSKVLKIISYTLVAIVVIGLVYGFIFAITQPVYPHPPIIPY